MSPLIGRLSPQVEALKRAVLKLRAEREDLRKELLSVPSECCGDDLAGVVGKGSSGVGGAPVRASILEAIPNLDGMLSEERVMQAEARDMKAQLKSIEGLGKEYSKAKRGAGV